VAAIPGVAAVGLTEDLHLSPLNNLSTDVVVPGVDPPPGREAHGTDRARVTEGFFDAAAVRLVDGRPFEATDALGGNPVAIVSEAFVRKFWPGRGAIGQTMRVGEQEVTVVGVAGDAKVRALGEDPVPFLYLPYAQDPTGGMTLVARTQGGADALLGAVLAAARRLDPDVVVIEAKTMERHLGAALLPHRLGA